MWRFIPFLICVLYAAMFVMIVGIVLQLVPHAWLPAFLHPSEITGDALLAIIVVVVLMAPVTVPFAFSKSILPRGKRTNGNRR